MSAGGTLTSLSVYVGATPAGASVRVALYTTNGSGNPGTLVAQSAPKVVTSGWNTFSISPGANVSAGTYWILAQTNNRNTVFRIVSGRGAGDFVGWTRRSWGTFPSTVASWSKFSNQSFCMYGAVQ